MPRPTVQPEHRARFEDPRDDGAVLPFVIVMIGAIAAIVLALLSYAATDLRAGQVVESRAHQLSAADAGMRYAIDQLKLRNAGCVLDTQKAVLPGADVDFNGASATVSCERITTGYEGIQAYAAVLTGEGLDPSDDLLKSQAGSNDKVLGGPVFMSRIDSDAFDLGPPVSIENGPLLYHDTSGASPCSSVSASTMPDQLRFEPELIFGPVCVSVSWNELFDSPDVPDLNGLSILDGSAPVGDPNGSYYDVTGGGGCRVFLPGRYTTPPDTLGVDAYFMTGDYLLDFSSEWEIRQSAVIAGRINTLTTTVNELSTTNACEDEQRNDPAPVDETGATFYLAGTARINVGTQGAIEIHARQQGSDYVSVQTLCAPNGDWCNTDGDGGLGAAFVSTLTAPASFTDNVIYTDSGNQKEFVAQALVYAPLAQIEFGNVTNTATQKMKGGLIVSRLVLQSSTSATNFEISVPTSPITARIELTSTAIKESETSVKAIVEYRPYEESIDDRVRINSWRVCERGDCDDTPPPSCGSGDAAWTASYWNNASLAGAVDAADFLSDLDDLDLGFGSPDPAINSDTFSARFERTVTFPTAGTYTFTAASDDGIRLWVDGVQVINDWSDQNYIAGDHVVDVDITDRCDVPIVLEYYENNGQSRVSLTWAPA